MDRTLNLISRCDEKFFGWEVITLLFLLYSPSFRGVLKSMDTTIAFLNLCTAGVTLYIAYKTSSIAKDSHKVTEIALQVGKAQLINELLARLYEFRDQMKLGGKWYYLFANNYAGEKNEFLKECGSKLEYMFDRVRADSILDVEVKSDLENLLRFLLFDESIKFDFNEEEKTARQMIAVKDRQMEEVRQGLEIEKDSDHVEVKLAQGFENIITSAIDNYSEAIKW